MISWRFIFQKLIHLILVFIGVSIVTFCISHVIPGDPARMLVGPHASPETLAARQSLGLDKPVLTQYAMYMEGLAHGDMGVSIRTQMPVSGELARYFPATLELTLAAMVIAVVFGIFLGVLSAVHRDSWVDHICRVISMVGVSIPLFWSGVVCLILFYKVIPIFPASGRLDTFLTPPPQVTGLYVIDGLIAGNMDVVISAIKNLIPDMVRIPSFIVVIASFVTLLQMVMQAYVPALYATLGLFIPLIVVNCIVLGRAEAFAAKNNPVASFFDGLGMGLGFTIALTLLGAVREFLGTGKIFNLTILPEEYGMLVFVLAPGAFIALGYLIALVNSFKKA